MHHLQGGFAVLNTDVESTFLVFNEYDVVDG